MKRLECHRDSLVVPRPVRLFVVVDLLAVLALLSSCRGVAPGDPGLKLMITNQCGFDVEVEMSLRHPVQSFPEDWISLPDGATVGGAFGADDQPGDLVVSVRRPGLRMPKEDLVPSSATVTLTSESGCPA